MSPFESPPAQGSCKPATTSPQKQNKNNYCCAWIIIILPILINGRMEDHTYPHQKKDRSACGSLLPQLARQLINTTRCSDHDFLTAGRYIHIGRHLQKTDQLMISNG
jgi:hypothetical protein